MHAYIFILPIYYIMISFSFTPSPEILIFAQYSFFFKSLTLFDSMPVTETNLLFLLFGWQTPPPKCASCSPPAVVGDVLRQSR